MRKDAGSPSDLFVVVGRNDFFSLDEGSVILCRSCFDADQKRGLANLASDTFVISTKAFPEIEDPECEGHRCCKAHHGPECAKSHDYGFDCLREGKYDARRAKTRESLRAVVTNRRIASLEVVAIVTLMAVTWIGLFLVWKAYKVEGESNFGSVYTWAFFIGGGIVATLVPRYLMFGTVRKKIRLPK